MNTQPEQPTIPGLPKPDRRAELRAAIDYHRKEADAAKREMKTSALALAGYMVDSVRPNEMQLRGFVMDFADARKRFLDATAEAGDAVDELRREDARIRIERSHEEGGAE